MNIVLLQDTDFIQPGRAVLNGRRFEHLVRVNRVHENEKLRCGILNGNLGDAVVREIRNDGIELEVPEFKEAPPRALPLTLVLAMPRPKMLKRIIESATSIGIKQIYLVNSWRVEKSYWKSPVLEPEKLNGYVRLGLEQAKDTIVPDIHLRRLFSPFVNKELPEIAADKIKIAAHPTSVNKCPFGVNKPVVLAIGPEGGFIDREIDTFKAQGFDIFHIGERILRVETAVTFLTSRLFI